MTARWGAPQQQESLIGSELGDSPYLVKHCPKCYEQMSAASRVCHRCLTSLSDVTAVPRESSDVTGDAEPIRLWRYLRRVPGRRALQMILLAALVSVVCAQCFWPESSRNEASGSRSLSYVVVGFLPPVSRFRITSCSPRPLEISPAV